MFNAETLKINCIDFYPETLLVSWECNLGFGQCEFSYDNRAGKWSVHAECMSDNFVQALINKIFENREIVG